MTLYYTIGEKLGIVPSKTIKTSGNEPKMPTRCPCGRGDILYKNGVSLYRVWLESSSFGRPEYSDCCSQCEQEERFELYDE
jgi:hypothetical protein